LRRDAPARSTPILLLANQPFQLEIMCRLAKELQEQGLMTRLFLTDLYTIIYAPEIIDKAQKEIGSEIITLKSEFISWQDKGEPDPERVMKATAVLELYNSLKSRGRNLATLRLTDPYTNGYEFNSWYLPISKNWQDVAHAETLLKCQSVVLDTCPGIIVSIDNSLLPTNFIHALTENHCTFITFQHTRIGSRWMPRYDFALGSYLDSKSYYQHESQAKNVECEIDQFLKNFNQKSQSLYVSPANLFGSRPTISFFREFLELLIHIPRSIFRGPSSRKLEVRRFDQNFLKINFAEGKRRLAKFLPDHSLTPHDLGTKGYFFWTLHYRPEGSGLVLGKGEDEIEIVLELAKLLQEFNQTLVVKENPLMFGTRKLSTMRRLARQPNLLWAPRFSHSISWIREARGVLGISGTSLLEAAFLDIPAFSFGVPEYLPCVWSRNDTSLNQFIKGCIDGNLESRSNILLDYLKYVFSCSSDYDSMLNALSDPREMQKDIQRMSSEILTWVK